MKLLGKKVVVTGASQGLGYNIASLFAREGADLLICARSGTQVKAAHQEIGAQAQGRVFAEAADVAIENDVRRLVNSAIQQMGGVDVLICNAGIYGPKGAIDALDWEDWVQTIHINLIGTVMCCRLFLPILRTSPHGKIILISGGGATKPMPFLSAYAASKAAIVRFGETLAAEVKSAGIDVNSVAPGALNTRMLQEIIAAGPNKVGQDFYAASLRQRDSGGTPLEKGSRLCLYLASDESNGITGKLISAVWDPWQEFQDHREDLIESDIFTLRRIVPSERGLDWK